MQTNDRPDLGNLHAATSRPTVCSTRCRHVHCIRAGTCAGDGILLGWLALDLGGTKWETDIRVPRRWRGIPAVAAVSPDGTTFAGTASAETVGLWKCDTGTKLGLSPLAHGNRISGIRYSPNGRFLVTTTTDGTVSLWKTEDASLAWKRQVTASRIKGICFVGNGNQLVVDTSNDEAFKARLSLFDVGTGNLIEAEPIVLFPEACGWDQWANHDDV